MRNRWWATTVFAVATLAVAACGSSGSGGGSTSSGSTPASTSSVVKTTKIGGATVLTNAKGLTLYTFAIDGMNTFTRSEGTTPESWNGHPLYTYIGDSAPVQDKGNGLNLSGGVWHVAAVSGAPAPSQGSSSSGGGGY